MCLKFILGKLDPSTPCVMSLIKFCYKQEHGKCSQRQKVVQGIQIGTNAPLSLGGDRIMTVGQQKYCKSRNEM